MSPTLCWSVARAEPDLEPPARGCCWRAACVSRDLLVPLEARSPGCGISRRRRLAVPELLRRRGDACHRARLSARRSRRAAVRNAHGTTRLPCGPGPTAARITRPRTPIHVPPTAMVLRACHGRTCLRPVRPVLAGGALSSARGRQDTRMYLGDARWLRGLQSRRRRARRYGTRRAYVRRRYTDWRMAAAPSAIRSQFQKSKPISIPSPMLTAMMRAKAAIVSPTSGARMRLGHAFPPWSLRSAVLISR